MAKSTSSYRSMFHLRKGGLHKALHVAPDSPIPEGKLHAALHSNSEHLRKMAQFAQNAKSFHH